MTQRLLTDDEINEARRLMKRNLWVEPIILVVACALSVWIAAAVSLWGLSLLVFMIVVAIVRGNSRRRRSKDLNTDIANRTVEVVEGAPERVWTGAMPGDTFLRLSGRTLKVSSDYYSALKQATFVDAAILPTSNIAVSVHPRRGSGIS